MWRNSNNKLPHYAYKTHNTDAVLLLLLLCFDGEDYTVGCCYKVITFVLNKQWNGEDSPGVGVLSGLHGYVPLAGYQIYIYPDTVSISLKCRPTSGFLISNVWTWPGFSQRLSHFLPTFSNNSGYKQQSLCAFWGPVPSIELFWRTFRSGPGPHLRPCGCSTWDGD